MKFRKKYSIQFKLKCLELVPILGIYRTSLILGIHKTCIISWNLNKQKLQKIKEKNSSYRLPGGGSKVKFPNKENEIFLFIDRCKEIEIKLNMNSIIEEFCCVCPQMKKYSKNSLRKWYYRFLKRFNFNIKDFQ